MNNVNLNENTKNRAGAPLKTLVCAIDAGFGRVKVAYKDSLKSDLKIFSFSSSVSLNKEALDLSKTLYIDNIAYDTSSSEKLTDKQFITKENDYTIVNMKRAIYEIYKKTKTKNFIVGLGCSLDTYKSKEAVESLRKKALETRVITFKEYDKEEVTLTIEDVFIQAETACSIFNMTDVNANDMNFIVDLGTLNSQILRYNRSLDIENARVKNFGYASIVKKISDKFRTLNKDFDEKTVEYFIENLDKQNKNIQKVINDYVIEEFLKETLMNELIISKVDLDFCNLVFCGGTSARFATQIRKVFKNCKFVQNPLHSNVIGMYVRTNKIYKENLKKQELI